MRLEVIRRDELDRMGGHGRQIEHRPDIEQAIDQTLGMRLAKTLQFQIIAPGKQRGPGFGSGTRGVGFVVQNCLRHIAEVPARQGQQAVSAIG